MTFKRNFPIDLISLSTRIKTWFLRHGWVVEDLEREGMVAFKAKTKRSAYSSNPNSVTVFCYRDKNKTKVVVKECGWNEGLKTNILWLFVTGGTNLSLKNRRAKMDASFKKYVEGVMGKLSMASSNAN